MSKASALGTGSSFQQTRAISPRRAAIDAATKAPTDGAPPPVELPVTAISLNPDNPRSSLGDLTSLVGSIRDHGQKAAISIMGRFAYLEANPGKEDDLEPETRFVVIDGNSRLAAAREAGLKNIKVMLDDELGKNPDDILESALVANIHRQDLDHLDEAKALEKLLKVHGSQEALAARLHRSQGWVSQRLALLGLTPELKQLLESGREPAELLRRVGNKKPEEQEDHLRRLKEKKAEEAAARKPRGGTRAATKPQKATGVRSEAQRSSGEDDGIGALHGEGGEQPSAQADTGTAGIGTAGIGTGPGAGAGLLPTLDPEQLAVLINRQMDRHSRKRLIALLLQYNDAEFTESEPTEPTESA